MKKLLCLLVVLITTVAATLAQASLIIPVCLTSNSRTTIGTIKADDTIFGLLLTPCLRGLSPGAHGIHIHQFPFCSALGVDAGGHFDPNKTGQHRGPYGSGHLGDLPVLIVDGRGRATLPILAPRLKLSDLYGRTLVINTGGDNYADIPYLNGGCGMRIACGVFPDY